MVASPEEVEVLVPPVARLAAAKRTPGSDVAFRLVFLVRLGFVSRVRRFRHLRYKCCSQASILRMPRPFSSMGSMAAVLRRARSLYR